MEIFRIQLFLIHANFLVPNCRDEEGMEHLNKRKMKLPFMFTTGDAILYEISSPFPSIMDPLPIKTKTGAGGKESLKKFLSKGVLVEAG